MKRIILCLDGTWNNTNKKETRDDHTQVVKPANPLKVARAVIPVTERGIQQLTYYDAGVGAMNAYPDWPNRFLGVVDRSLGGLVGAGFEGNVEDAYLFLAHNVQPDDEVYVFGFSRGASQARALCHFLDWMGGVPAKRDAYWIPRYFEAYLTSRGVTPSSTVTKKLGRHIEGFVPVTIKYLGVWDSVLTLGLRLKAKDRAGARGDTFFLKPTTPGVRHARQALAIDEVRWDFRPEIWHARSPVTESLEQRWFPGVHSNVGGGYVNDGLANGALHWILRGATELGLQLDDDFIKKYKMFFIDELYDSRSSFYKAMEGIRCIFRPTLRDLEPRDLDPIQAGITIDHSVFDRMTADPHARKENGDLKYPDMKGASYRPKNLKDYLLRHPEYDSRLPFDLRTEIQGSRPSASP